MWIIENKDKENPDKIVSYKYVERYYDHEGEQKYVSKTLKSDSPQAQKKAQKILDKKIADKLKVVEVNKENISFEQLGNKWLKLKEKSIKPSTHLLYKRTLEQIYRLIGDTQIDQLTAGQVNRAFLVMFNNGISYKTVSERYKIIKSVLKFGVDYDYLEEDNISHKLRLEKMNVSEKREDKYLEMDESEKLFEALVEAGHEELADFFNLQMQTGMRFGELSALHLPDIDFENNTIFIRFTYDKGNKMFTLPKNNKTRTINVNPETMNLIKKIMRRRKILLMAYGVPKTTLLFFRDDGTPLDIYTCTRILHQFENPDKPLTTHIFRHTFITRMAEQYVPAALIAEHVGHSDTQMVERIYSHFTDKMDKDLKEAINAVKF